MLVASSSLSSADYAGNSNTNTGRYGVKSVIYKVFGSLNSIQSSFFSPSHIQRQIMTKQIIHQQSAIQSLVYSLSLPSPHSPSHRGTHSPTQYLYAKSRSRNSDMALPSFSSKAYAEFVRVCDLSSPRKTRAYIIGGNLCCAASKAMQSWWAFFVTIVPIGSMVQNFCIQYIYCILHQDQVSACAWCAFLWLSEEEGREKGTDKPRNQDKIKPFSFGFPFPRGFLAVQDYWALHGRCLSSPSCIAVA